jgi:uncharacterized protein
VPLALIWISNQVLSPALVLVELVINAVALIVNGRAVPRIWRRVMPLLLGILPGAILGTFALARADHQTLRIATYLVLLPLVLLQATGVRRPIRSEAAAGVPLGASIGALYAATSICGPPLSLLLNNQGYEKDDFRASLALFRAIQSVITVLLYSGTGLFGAPSLHITLVVAPSVLIGVPLGFTLLRRIPNETFRRICMAADVLIVGFGLSQALSGVGLIVAAVGAAVLAAALVWLKLRTRSRPPTHSPAEAQS